MLGSSLKQLKCQRGADGVAAARLSKASVWSGSCGLEGGLGSEPRWCIGGTSPDLAVLCFLMCKTWKRLSAAPQVNTATIRVKSWTPRRKPESLVYLSRSWGTLNFTLSVMGVIGGLWIGEEHAWHYSLKGSLRKPVCKGKSGNRKTYWVITTIANGALCLWRW